MARLKGFTFGYIPNDLLFSPASSNAKIMYAVLTRYINDNAQAWPTQETLSRRLSWSESTVRRTINELLRLGWLTKEQSRVHHGGEWAANIYRLNHKPRYLRKKLPRHRRSNLTAGADQGKHTETAGRNRRSNLTGRTRENEFWAQSEAARPDGRSLPRTPLKAVLDAHRAGCKNPSPWVGKDHKDENFQWSLRELWRLYEGKEQLVLDVLGMVCEQQEHHGKMERMAWELQQKVA